MSTYYMPLPEDQRKQAVRLLESMLWTPYIYGGSDFSGFDCSGAIVEVLQAVGLMKHRTDLTARGLYGKFEDKTVEYPSAGCLVFWWVSALGEKIVNHVEMLIDNYYVIGASGGSSKTGTIQDAIHDDAYIKMRPLNYRGENYIIVDPFKDD